MSLYACHNHAPHGPKPYRAQDGTVVHTLWLPVQCGHVGALDDPKCRGCRWRADACPHPVTIALDSIGAVICDDCKTVIRR